MNSTSTPSVSNASGNLATASQAVYVHLVPPGEDAEAHWRTHFAAKARQLFSTNPGPEDRITVEYDFTLSPQDDHNRIPLEEGLKEAIQLARQRGPGAYLVLSNHKPLEYLASLPLLLLLRDSGQPLSCLDFAAFNENSITYEILLLEHRRNNSQTEATRTGSGRQTATRTISADVRQQGLLKKLQKAYLNHNSLQSLRELKKFSRDPMLMMRYPALSDQATYLNQLGLATPRGKAHTAKSVERLKKMLSQDLPKHYNESFSLEHDLAPMADVPLTQQLNRLELTNDAAVLAFDDEIQLRLVQPSTSPLTLVIQNNEEEEVHRQVFPAPVQEIILQILRDTSLLPGRYYFTLSGSAYKVPLKRAMVLYADLID